MQCKKKEAELLDANMPLVLNVAKLYKGRGVPLSILVEAGKMGLIEAIEKFDCEKHKNIKFITYAVWWVVKQMHRECEWKRARIIK